MSSCSFVGEAWAKLLIHRRSDTLAYDGGYLTTPGINTSWRWRPHQTAVIARILQSGSTYMAHTVGAGKTSAMIGSGMESRRLGLAKKPMYVVPNHMLVQFTTEFYDQYPLAKILVADEKRFHTSTRKQFVADAALGDWDAIIITHSGFEKIPPSEASVNGVVDDLLAEVKSVLNDTPEGTFGEGGQGQERAILTALGSMGKLAGVNVGEINGQKGVSTRKKIEQIIEATEQRMSRQIDRRDQDQVFNFDELGVDMLIVDEAHKFRKLSFATTNGDIKGIDPGGSNKSMDLFIKARAMDKINPGRGLVFSSGTPITNTMAELYSISRYMQPQALKERGVDAFDGWASTFGSVESELEQTPSGGYKQVSRFSKFVNTPELSLMVRQIMDVVTGPDLERYVTRPKIKNGQRTLVVVEPSAEVKAYQEKLAARMDAIAERKGPVKAGDDIILSVINDGRMSAIDARLVDPDATGAGSKLEAAIQNIYRTWKQGANSPLYGVKDEGGYTDDPTETGPTTQIVFATRGINPTKHNPSFSVHRFIKAELVRMGVPASDIILTGDMKSDNLKQRAFNDMNDGKKRILVGSESLFTGVNAQRRLAAIHNLDPLWFPADDEQRNGRGIRQGNMNREIEIFDYSTKGTYDATMWQMMGRKAGFIEGFFRGDPNMREMEDMGEASQYQQAQALSTRDPRVLELTEMRQKRDELDRRRGAIERQKRKLANETRNKNHSADKWAKDLVKWEEAAGNVVDLKGDKFAGKVEGEDHTERKDFGQAIIDIALGAESAGSRVRQKTIGTVSGFTILYSFEPSATTSYLDIQPFGGQIIEAGFSYDAVGLARRVEGAVGNIQRAPVELQIRIDDALAEADAAKEQLGKIKEFGQLQELRLLEEKIDTLEDTLAAEVDNSKDKEMRAPDGWGEVKADAPITNAQIADAAKDAQRELEASGLAGKVTAKVARRIITIFGDTASGVYRRGRGAIEVRHDATAGPIGVLRHEIVHALRDAAYWGGSKYGLFTKTEWQGLVREARKDKAALEELRKRYPDLSTGALMEEAVAELYRRWRGGAEAGSAMTSTEMGKIKLFFEALANALLARGFQSASRTMQSIADGGVASRGDPNPTGPKSGVKEMRARKEPGLERAPSVNAKSMKGGASQLVSDMLTQAMAGKGGVNLLSLVPGRALMSELSGKMPAVKTYLRLKEKMDTLRNHYHSETDVLAQKWRKLLNSDKDANERLMNLMHDSTIEGQDPTKPFLPLAEPRDPDLVAKYGARSRTGGAAQERIEADRKRRRAYDDLRSRFMKLPTKFRDMYSEVRDSYTNLASEFETAIEENAGKAMNVAVRRAERAHARKLEEISDDGLTGRAKADAIAEAGAVLKTAKMQNQWAKTARLQSLRARFESNRLQGPYFPLKRFGDFYVTLRDKDGKVVSFSRFEGARAQRKYADEMKVGGFDVETGVMKEMSARDSVDPGFVADIEDMLGEIDADTQVMDAIWQRWLQTLPDMSQRKSRLHRKGTPGYAPDAFRAFAYNMFHGAHQLARLKYSLDMGEALDVAEEEARRSDNPERNGLIVKEVSRRNDFVMNPKGSALAQTMTSAAFVYYLGWTPAAALVNITQTSVVGIPILGAFYGKGGTRHAARELTRALADFTRGKGHAANSKNLTPDEKKAMAAAYDMGAIDKSQGHDIAGVGETGVEYSDRRTKVMEVVSFAFHHAERLNREVTFLAAYRLAKKKGGLSFDEMVEKAADLTWKTHFDYQNSSRPRLLQNDFTRVAFVFRNFQINMLWRLFRDTHQSLVGEDAETRAEARRQLIGISTQMLLHAGVKGVWGYSIIMALAGMFFAGGGDDAEKEMEKALLAYLPRDVVGAMLNGVPGHLLGIDLRNRVGMPDLWFRSPSRELEGEDEYNYWVQQFLGAVPGMAQNVHRGFQQIFDGEAYRGVETIVPKAIRDVLRSGRYAVEGAQTYNDDPIVAKFQPHELIAQFLGFTPARLSERYDANTRLKNEERRILDDRRAIMKEAGTSALKGSGIPDRVIDESVRSSVYE